jgi:hypothetical protein
LFQPGWEDYRISVIDRKGDRLAERYGAWLEGRDAREKYTDDEEYRQAVIYRLVQPTG